MCQLALGLAEELPRIDRRLVLGLLLLLFLSVQHGGKHDQNKNNDSGDGATVATAATAATARRNRVIIVDRDSVHIARARAKHSGPNYA